MAPKCDYCGTIVPNVVPFGTILCPCGARVAVGGDKVLACDRPKVAAPKLTGRPRASIRGFELTQEVRDDLIALVQNGANPIDIAEIASIPLYLVRKAVRGHSPLGRKGSARMTRREIEMEWTRLTHHRANLPDAVKPSTGPHDATSSPTSDDRSGAVAIPPADGPPLGTRARALWEWLQYDPADRVASRDLILRDAARRAGTTTKEVIDAIAHEIAARAYREIDHATIAADLGVDPAKIEAAIAYVRQQLSEG